jgi:hypothetical protein
MKKTHYSTLLVLAMTLTLCACNLINPEEQIPAYLHIPAFAFSADESTDGTSSENITEIWAYTGAVNLGAFSLPADIPILEDGAVNLSLRAGIRANGISATRIVYPFYSQYNTTVMLERGVVDTIAPEFTYKDDLYFPLIVDFDEFPVFATESDSEVEFERITDQNEVFEGAGCGFALIGEDQNIFRASTNEQQLVLPHNKQCFLEMDYKCNNTFAVGLYAINSAGSEKHLALIINPTSDAAGVPQWNKIYVELLPITGATLSATEYEIYIESIKEAGNSEARLYFDNIKVIHY